MYIEKGQYAKSVDASLLLIKSDKKFVQEVIGTFVYYARVVDSTILAPLGSITTHQANVMKNTMNKVKQFSDHAATHPGTIATYHASDMVYSYHSDASYLSESKAHSHTCRYF